MSGTSLDGVDGVVVQFSQDGALQVLAHASSPMPPNVRDELRGRVLSLYTLTFLGVAPFGNLLVGSLSAAIGLTTAIIFSAAISFVFSALILFTVPSVRRLA